LIVKPTIEVSNDIKRWRLGAGESSVQSMVGYHDGTGAIIDDLAGRRYAASLDLPVRGTLGIVLVAKD